MGRPGLRRASGTRASSARLDVFIDDTQKYVSGDIRLKLQGGRAVVTGRKSEQSLYDFNLATYDTGDTFDQSLAKGFIEIWSLPSKISARRDLRASSRVREVTDGRSGERLPSGAPASPTVPSPELVALSRSTHFDWQLAPYDIAGFAGARQGARGGGLPRRRSSCGAMLAALDDARGRRASTARSVRSTPTKTCTSPSSASSSTRSGPSSAASCAPAAAATTRSPR